MNEGIDEVVAIQVQPTRLTGGGVEMIPLNDKLKLATHWSLYKRKASGECTWVADIQIQQGKTASNYHGDALIAAAKLSMQYGVSIENIR